LLAPGQGRYARGWKGHKRKRTTVPATAGVSWGLPRAQKASVEEGRMEIGLFTRNGKHLNGRIGALELTWDRTAGGTLQATYSAPSGAVPVGALSLGATLEEAQVSTVSDADPRLIPVEAGPQRLVLRAVQQLLDASGRHLGDAMQETWAWADGDLYLNGMIRLVDPQRGGRLLEASAELRLAEGWRPASEPVDGAHCLAAR